MQNSSVFLDAFFEQIAAAGLDISGLALDHIAYQASSSDEYETLKPIFAGQGQLVSEEVVGERRVAVFALTQPIPYKTYAIPAMEIIEPKVGQVCESGFQHAEFVTDRPFTEWMTQYPQLNWDTSSMERAEFSHLKLNFANGLTLKFLLKPILELVGKSA